MWLITSLMLTLLGGRQGIVGNCEASRVDLSCVLMWNDKFIAYVSRQLKFPEKNYQIHDKELDVVVFSLTILYHYLYGVHVDVFTDHKSLQYVLTKKELNLKQSRYLELHKDYNLSIL